MVGVDGTNPGCLAATTKGLAISGGRGGQDERLLSTVKAARQSFLLGRVRVVQQNDSNLLARKVPAQLQGNDVNARRQALS